MKRVIGFAVAVAVCGMFWLGCQKKATEPAAPGAKPGMAQPMTPPPPPPPPPPPATPPAGGGQ